MSAKVAGRYLRARTRYGVGVVVVSVIRTPKGGSGWETGQRPAWKLVTAASFRT
jgi:hypothetical protein